MRLHLLTFFGLAALALGCEGGQTGGQTGDLSGNSDGGGLETGGGNCEEHRQKLDSFDEETEAGTAEQVLAFAEKSFSAPLSWREPRQGQSWAAGPETGQSSIRIDITRGENAYFLTYTPKPNSSGIEIAVLCPGPRLGVEAHVDVTTEGGALAESFDTLIYSETPGVASLSTGLDLEKLSGDLDITYSNPNTTLVQLGLNVTFLAEGMTGSLGGIEQTASGDAVSAGGAVLAVWPDSPACAEQYTDGSGISVAPDQIALGVTGEAAAASLTATTPVAVTWLDGTTTQLSLTATVVGDGCLKATNGYGVDGDAAPGATYPASFVLTSEDGRMQGEYEGRLVSSPNGVSAEAHLQLSLEQLAQSGFDAADVPAGVERLAVVFQARVEDGVASGALRLDGLTDPPCLTEPQSPQPTPGGGMSSPGCPGTKVTPIEAASWLDQ